MDFKKAYEKMDITQKFTYWCAKEANKQPSDKIDSMIRSYIKNCENTIYPTVFLDSNNELLKKFDEYSHLSGWDSSTEKVIDMIKKFVDDIENKYYIKNDEN